MYTSCRRRKTYRLSESGIKTFSNLEMCRFGLNQGGNLRGENPDHIKNKRKEVYRQCGGMTYGPIAQEED